MSKIEAGAQFIFRWGAILALAILAVAGALHLVAGVSPVIAYSVSITLVAFLIRETL